MLAVWITLTPGRRNLFIDSQNAKVYIVVLPIMDVKTLWNSTLELLERAYRLREITRKWLQNPKYPDYRPLFTTQDEWTIVKYVTEVLRPFQYSTLWMSKRHTVTLHHIITVYNDIFDHMDGMKWAFTQKRTPFKEDLFFAVKFARQKLFKYNSEVSPIMGMILISAYILDSFWKFRSFRKWDKGMDIDPEDETSYTTQYQEAFLKYVENENSDKHWCVPVNKHESLPSSNLIPPATVSGYCQSSFDPYDLYSDDEEYLTPNNVTVMTPGWSNRVVCLLMAAMLCLNPPTEAPKNWVQINLNLNDYHCNPMENSSTCWLPVITDWWRQLEETHSQYADLFNVARDIFSIIPHCVGVEASIPLGRDVISCRQSTTTHGTLREKVVIR